MDLLSMLKMANIFSPQGPNQQQFPVGSIGGPETPPVDASQAPPDLNTAIQGLLNPKDTQFQNFADMINQMPRRQDYQPSNFRKIAGAIAGLGAGGPVGIANGQVVGYKANVPEGMKIQSAITDEPYNKALSDWATKLEPTEKIAQMEANRNTNLRQIGLGEQSRQIQQQRADIAAQAEKDQTRARDEANRIRDERAQAYIRAKQFSMDHPTYKSYIDKDGMLVFVNPTDPSSPPVKTDIDTGKLNDMEKIDLQVQGRLSEIAAQSKGRTEFEGIRQANRKELEGVRQIDRLDLKQTAPGTNSKAATATNPKPLTPSAERTAQQNKAVGIINDHPELKVYFEMGGNKLPTGQLIAPKDPNDAGYQIAQRLMGKSSDIKLGSDINPKLNVQPSPSATQPSGTLTRPEDPRIKAARAKVEAGYVLITDGKSFGQVKPTDVDRLPKGWMVVK